MTSKIDAIAREMARVLLETTLSKNETDERVESIFTRDNYGLSCPAPQLRHLAAFVFSMIEQAKKETRQEARDHMAERGL